MKPKKYNSKTSQFPPRQNQAATTNFQLSPLIIFAVALIIISITAIMLLKKNPTKIANIGNAGATQINIPLLRHVSELKGKEVLLSVRDQSVASFRGSLVQAYDPINSSLFSSANSSSVWAYEVPLVEKAKQETAPLHNIGLANPLLLMFPYFRVFDRTNPQGIKIRDNISAEEIGILKGLSSQPIINQLRYINKLGQVNVYITDYVEKLHPLVHAGTLPSDLTFDLLAFNALDFGFTTIALEQEQTTNIEYFAEQMQIMNITARFDLQSDGCGGNNLDSSIKCNGLIPENSNLNNLKIKGLPAIISFRLWKQAPSAVTDPADYRFKIHFR